MPGADPGIHYEGQVGVHKRIALHVCNKLHEGGGGVHVPLCTPLDPLLQSCTTHGSVVQARQPTVDTKLIITSVFTVGNTLSQ